MSPASYLTAPPRDAASIVASPSVRNRRGYHARVVTAAWIALIFLIVALAASFAHVVIHGLRLWRIFRSVGGAAESALSDVMRSADAAEAKAAALTGKSERIDQAREHLRQSLAQLATLRAAAAEASAPIARFSALLSRR